jgi:hypothetical protein
MERRAAAVARDHAKSALEHGGYVGTANFGCASIQVPAAQKP